MNPKHWSLVTLAPLVGAALSIVVFSVLGPALPSFGEGVPPKWLWLWLFQMGLVIPFWKTLSSHQLESQQRGSLTLGSFQIPLGSHKFYLLIAYLSAASAVVFHGTWFSTWLVFGGIVSPIFEELFTRNLLTPWLNQKWSRFIAISIASSATFSLMHWGFNGMSAFDLPLEQQIYKFLGHFQFGLLLCVVFRLTKSLQVCIGLHMFQNLQFIFTKL